jgi:hypothetical protein
MIVLGSLYVYGVCARRDARCRSAMGARVCGFAVRPDLALYFKGAD